MSVDERDAIDRLGVYINERWEQELSQITGFNAGVDGDEGAARELIETFIEYCDNLKIAPVGGFQATACLVAVRKMMLRVLDVDMEKPANRKGDLPRAMGLASRRDAVDRIRDRVIFSAVYHARYDMQVAERPLEECADLVIDAFAKNKNPEGQGLTRDKVIKTYQRELEKTLGAP